MILKKKSWNGYLKEYLNQNNIYFMPLIEDKEIKEIYDLKHRNDDYPKGFNYFDNILKKSLSPFIFLNDNMNGFLLKLQPLVSHMFDQMGVVRNWKSWYVDKYKNDHTK